MKDQLKTFRSVRIGVAALFLVAGLGFAVGAVELMPEHREAAYALAECAVVSSAFAGYWLGMTKRFE